MAGKCAANVAISAQSDRSGTDARLSVPSASGSRSATSAPTSGSRPPMCRFERGQRDCREVLITDVMDAEPSNKVEYPAPSIWPFLCAVVTGAFFIGSIFTPWALPVAIIPLTITLIGWFWPKSRRSEAPGVAAPIEEAA